MNPNDPKGAAGALKTPLGLIPSYAMEQTAWVHKLGSDKYGPYNWRKTGVCASTYVNAMLRHLNAWRDGETLDPESGISHLAHVACSCNILLDADHCGTLQDDRNVKPPNTPASKMDKPKPILYTLRHPLIGEEYRRLEDGEAFMEGDEMYDPYDDLWLPIISWSGKICCWKDLARRKVEPVEEPVPTDVEYRFLEVGELIQDSDQFYAKSIDQWLFTNIGHMSLHNTEACKYRRKVEPVEIPDEKPEQPVETEYRFLKEGELIQEGDEYWCCGDWCVTEHNKHCPSRAAVKNFYRRKDERTQECTCGRIKINHHTLGWICEDCEWHGEPY